MYVKASSYLSAHYPNTYMENFCKNLHPDLELGTLCISWFRHAARHCTDIISNNRLPTTYFWNTVKHFIFPDHSTELLSKKVPISIHPKRLSMHDCQSLFLDIVNDYIEKAPRYAAESITNVMLWQVLYSLTGVITLGFLLTGIIYAYNKYGQHCNKLNPLEKFFGPEKCLQAAAKRSLSLAKSELRNIKVKPIAMPDQILPADGAAVMAIKVSSKYHILETVVEGCLQSTGKLHRLYDHYNKTKTEYRIETLTKALKFLDHNCKKLHLILMFDDSLEYEENIATKKRPSSPLIKNVSPRRVNSPRQTTDSSKRLLNYKCDGGSLATFKAISTDGSSYTESPPSSKHVTPRSSLGILSSGIPRNTCKQRTTIRKSK